MENKYMLLSKNNVKQHLKKTWFVLLLAVCVGVLGFVMGIHSNLNDIKSKQKVSEYQQKIMFISDRISNAYIADFMVLTSENDFKKNVIGEEKNISLETERVEGSNILLLKVKGNKNKLKEVANDFVENGTELFNKYYPDVQVVSLENGVITNIDIPKVYVQMKDILLLILPILIGVVGVYISILWDNRFYDRNNLELYLGKQVCEFTMKDCIEALKKKKDILIVYGKGINEGNLKKLNAISLDEYNKKRETSSTNKILVLKKGYTKTVEIDEFLKTLSYDEKKAYDVFFIND